MTPTETYRIIRGGFHRGFRSDPYYPYDYDRIRFTVFAKDEPETRVGLWIDSRDMTKLFDVDGFREITRVSFTRGEIFVHTAKNKVLVRPARAKGP